MSGIVGVFYLEGDFQDEFRGENQQSNPQYLENKQSESPPIENQQSEHQAIASHEISLMLDALAHRGPDGSGRWCQGPVGLGHCLLWTTLESRLESLPHESSDRHRVITADARIDNRDELQQQLKLPDKAIHEITDSDFILAAYEKWGDRCPEKLLGDFAFVIWDYPQQRLFCARDHFGVKPFYYFKADNIFVFASEIKGLLAHPAVSPTVNEAHLLNHLTVYLEDKTSTAYEHIYRLPPAHTLTLSKIKTAARPEDFAPRQYWALDPDRESQLDSDADYEAAFHRIFSDAVRCRLRSALPVGAHLSGGLDSSSIVCMAQSLLASSDRPPLHTFSNIYPHVPGSDEQLYIDQVVTQSELTPHYVRADQAGPLSDRHQLFKHVDEPLIGNGYLVLGLNKAAQAENIRVVLNGFDGDTTVSHGILRLQELVDQNDWRTFCLEVKALQKNLSPLDHDSIRSHAMLGLKRWARKRSWIPFGCASWQLSSAVNVSFIDLLYKYGVRSLIAPWKKRLQKSKKNRELRYKNRIQNSVQSPLSVALPFVQTEFSRRAGLPNRPAEQRSRQVQSVRQEQWQSFTHGMTAAMEVVDVLSAPYSIEPRYPFMDKRLVEFCLALPAEQKLKNGWTRSILRRAMQGVLPESIQWRNGKTTPKAAFIYGLEKYDSSLVERLLADRDNVLKQYVNTEMLKQAYHAFLAGKSDSKITSGHVWAAISLKLWLQNRQLIDIEPVEPSKRPLTSSLYQSGL